jgi:hypothetical protein
LVRVALRCRIAGRKCQGRQRDDAGQTTNSFASPNLVVCCRRHPLRSPGRSQRGSALPLSRGGADVITARSHRPFSIIFHRTRPQCNLCVRHRYAMRLAMLLIWQPPAREICASVRWVRGASSPSDQRVCPDHRVRKPGAIESLVLEPRLDAYWLAMPRRPLQADPFGGATAQICLAHSIVILQVRA